MRYKSRKFLLALFTVASADVLLWFKLLDGSQFVTVVAGVLTAYFAANVTQKMVTKTDA